MGEVEQLVGVRSLHQPLPHPQRLSSPLPTVLCLVANLVTSLVSPPLTLKEQSHGGAPSESYGPRPQMSQPSIIHISHLTTHDSRLTTHDSRLTSHVSLLTSHFSPHQPIRRGVWGRKVAHSYLSHRFGRKVQCLVLQPPTVFTLFRVQFYVVFGSIHT